MSTIDLEKYETRAETEKRLGITHSWLIKLLNGGRFPGAFQEPSLNNQWFIPKGAEPTPIDYKHSEAERAKMRQYRRIWRAKQEQSASGG